MGTVADALREWADPSQLEGARGHALMAWAEAQGDDARAAWESCPRVDHLLALAGAFQAPLGSLVRTAGRLVRPALALAPKKDVAAATRAVYLAEHWGTGAKPAKDVAKPLEAAVARARAEHDARAGRSVDRGADALKALLEAPASLGAQALAAFPEAERSGEEALRAARQVIATETASLAEAPGGRERLRALGAEVQEGQRDLARLVALTAALDLGRAAESATLVMSALAQVVGMDDPEREAVDEDLVTRLAEYAAKLEANAYELLGQSLGLAAEALARDAAARWAGGGDAAFHDAVARTVAESALHGAARPGEPLGLMPLHAELERIIAAERLARLRAMADAVRAAVPYASLGARPKAA